MTPELQTILIGAVSVIVPALSAVVVAYLGKVKRDLDAAFSKLRAHEDVLEIKTTQDPKTKEQHVSRNPSRSGQVGSSDPQPIRPEGGEGSR